MPRPMAWRFWAPTAAPEWLRSWSIVVSTSRNSAITSRTGCRAMPAPSLSAFCSALDTTETFKQKKQELVRDGFDPRRVTDPLFFKDPKSSAYRPIDADAYARILEGSIRL